MNYQISKLENSEIKKSQVKVCEQRGIEWVEVEENYWADLQNSYWQYLKQILNKRND